MIVDTSGLLAFFNRHEPLHEATVSAVDTASELVVSPYVLAELDHLVATRLGSAAEVAVLEELSSGAWVLAEFGADDLRQATNVVTKYGDLGIGLADASLVVLADRHRTRQILTLDHRHFDVVRPIGGGRFRVLPGIG